MPETGADELCRFEVVPFNTLGSATIAGTARLDQIMPNELLPRDFVRHALGQGLLLQTRLGANPFAYGFVASTDTHLGTPGAVDERSFMGHGGAGQAARDQGAGLVDTIWFNPGGLAVLWAEENSRAALFAAMKRREAYGTSGSRIVLRFFGGFDLPPEQCAATDFAKQGYARGVPMGGELAPPQGSVIAPRFAVYALRDPGSSQAPGVPLERVQIIKGSLVGEAVQYSVVDVKTAALSGTLDERTCQPSAGGADEICASWVDPTFDPNVPAFFYARVLEAPSCRWQAHACLAAGVDCASPATVRAGLEGCCDTRFPRVQQERAWSSPIFYRPR